jgi:hypothetical protein
MVAPLESHMYEFLTALSQAPKVFTLRSVPEDLGTHLSGTPQCPWSYGATRLPQPTPTSLGSGQASCFVPGLVCSGPGTQ